MDVSSSPMMTFLSGVFMKTPSLRVLTDPVVIEVMLVPAEA